MGEACNSAAYPHRIDTSDSPVPIVPEQPTELPAQAREVRLVRRPSGTPVPEDFEIAALTLPTPAAGEVLVRNLVFSVDPYMRGRMNEGPSYTAGFALGAAMDGGAVGEIVRSEDPALPVGTVVEHGLGWREYAVLPADAARPLEPSGAPLSLYLGALGMTGFTAWVGLLEIARMQPGETVFVSGAAGAVGSVVGQLARARGAALVIGSAGGPAKVEYLRETLHFDAALDHREPDIAGQLAAAAPDGIDVYFDNVGGEQLEAAIGSLRTHGRVAACGAISAYNSVGDPRVPRNLFQVVGKRLRIEGFIVSDHSSLQPAFRRELADLIATDAVAAPETVAHGLDSAVDAFLGLFTGANTGKAVVALADTSSSGYPTTT